MFGDPDDLVFSLAPDHTVGSSTVTIHIGAGDLPSGLYRLTVSGNTSIHDLSGLRLDGDEDGTEGGDYIRTFTVDATAPTVSIVPVCPIRGSLRSLRSALSSPIRWLVSTWATSA